MSEFESESALAMQVDRVHKSCFVFLFPRRGSPEGSEGWLGPRGRCVSPRADPSSVRMKSTYSRLTFSVTTRNRQRLSGVWNSGGSWWVSDPCLTFQLIQSCVSARARRLYCTAQPKLLSSFE